MKVRATQAGYYNHIRRRPGDVFTLAPVKGTKVTLHKDGREERKEHTFSAEEQFSERWMEKVSKHTPEKVTGAQKALNAASNALKSGGQGPESEDEADSVI